MGMIILVLLRICEGVLFSLEGYTEKCFGLSLEEESKFYADYSFQSRVMVRVYSGSGLLQYTSPRRSTKGTVVLTSFEPGVHKLCFKAFGKDSQTVKFNFEVVDNYTENLENQLSELLENLGSVYTNLEFHRVRESAYKDLVERASDIVIWGALCKISMLLAVGFLQLYFFSKLFSQKHLCSI